MKENEMSDSLEQFMDDYLQTWTASTQEARHHAIAELWSEEGTLSVSSTGSTLHGCQEIASHIDGVHSQLIEAKGLKFSYDQAVTSGDALLLRWSMVVPNGETVGRGVDVLFRDEDGKILRGHMFMGVN